MTHKQKDQVPIHAILKMLRLTIPKCPIDSVIEPLTSFDPRTSLVIL
ncbi:hypothetical protein F383_22700 [Gossypium arboreum]|uniref:Uncharacterized protein n=1 Tax=Gossypium arboreum TaxID=29729 RepID=A0A0B0ML00_GOSAR|nr:hypothetical protein F383_22700 [Gossypium arboreum]